MMICNICKNNFKNITLHLKYSHKEISIQDYYKSINVIEYCPICNKEKKFKNLTSGYQKTCGNKNCIKKLREATNIQKYGVGYNLQRKEIKEKCDNTFQIKYNGSSPFCSKEVQSKKDKTVNEKYNVSNVFQVKEVIETIKEKNKINFENLTIEEKEELKQNRGFVKCNPMYDEKYKLNRLKTFKEDYGHEYYNQQEDIKKQLSKNFKVNNPMCKDEIKEKNKLTRRKKFVENIFNGDRTNNLVTPLFNIEDFKNCEQNLLWKCNKCNHEFYDKLSDGNIPRCHHCFPTKSYSSYIEKEIQEFIEKYINIERNKRFWNKDTKSLVEVDIFIKEKNIGIELDGLYWHSEIAGKKDKNYHINKNKFFEKQNIKIFHIFDIEWITKKEIVKSLLLSKLNIYNEKFRASKLFINAVDSNIEKEFLNNNHLQGYISSKICLGLFTKNNELLSLISLGKPRYNKNYEWELLRFVNKKNTKIYGGFSKLLKGFELFIKPNSLITYADRRISYGEVYNNNGFILDNISDTNYYYTYNYNTLESRIKYQKHKLKNILKIYDKNITEWQNMQNNKFDRIWDCGNLVFIKKYK
jgi:hypothetical protein